MSGFIRTRGGLGLAALLLLSGLGVHYYLATSDAVYLSRAIPVGNGDRLVGYLLQDGPRVRPGDEISIDLLLESDRRPAKAPPVLVTPIGLNGDFERQPEFSRRLLNEKRLRRASTTVRIPAYLHRAPGAYALRVRGTRPIFALLRVEAPRR